MKSVQLDSGGFIKVDGQFDLFAFTARDREFFSQVCDLFQAFEKNSPVAVIARTGEVNSRSQQKRVAALKGEPAPTFAGGEQDPVKCGCDEYPECTHVLYWYQGFKAGQAAAPAGRAEQEPK